MHGLYFGIISILIAFFTVILVDDQSSQGKVIYEASCIRCHGRDGARKLFGAKDLHLSRIDSVSLVRIIKEGKRLMPGYKSKFSEDEIVQVSAYVRSLREE